jgi:hypothetical protein
MQCSIWRGPPDLYSFLVYLVSMLYSMPFCRTGLFYKLFHPTSQLMALALESLASQLNKWAFSTALSICSESRSCPSGQETRDRGQLLSCQSVAKILHS